jgi:pyruvate,orthophosphate dikinase
MICRLNPKSLDEMLHPIVDSEEEKTAVQVAEGLPAGPGGAWGKIVFTADDAVQMAKIGENVILVREETSPEDIEGMRAASAVLTARGGMTSHAALVARGWGKCCIVGAGAMKINVKNRQVQVGTRVFNEGDVFTLNGTKGIVYDGRLKMKDALENPKFIKFMAIADQHRTMGVRTNADTPEDAAMALKFGAQGIGLFRTEHMFYGADSDRPLFLLRKMILSKSTDERQAALDELFPFVKQEIQNTLEVMDNLPVTLRLLDPPLHEFVPESEANQMEIAKALGIDLEEVNKRSRVLKESNPMIGHRGVRLGITFPEITQMQVNAIFTAAAELIVSGNHPMPEIMVPVTCNEKELTFVKKIVDDCYQNVLKAYNLKQISYLFGTMIELPRAALIADKMAKDAQFFSFGTNDLTQMTFGFSRDDIGSFMNDYIDHAILDSDPFETLDQEAVGSLIDIAVERGRKTRPEIKLGICGEHGGDPASVTFCHKAGLTYVSCSPYRVPIARLAAAQAAIQEND